MSTGDQRKNVFLTGEWNDLIMANYQVDPAILMKYLPYKTELDSFHGIHYVSLVAFMFNKVKIKGFSVPFHRDFPEVNLRFYVRYRSELGWKRGVVFIREIVPRRAIVLIANTFFKEKYASAPMITERLHEHGRILIHHKWKWAGRVNLVSTEAEDTTQLISGGSLEEFITEHYWGYSSVGINKTNEYGVEHPKWAVHPLVSSRIECDFKSLYGKEFEGLANLVPDSVFHAIGSPIIIRQKSVIR